MKSFRNRLIAGAISASLMFAPIAAKAQGFIIPDGSAVSGHLKFNQAPAVPPPVGVGCTIAANAADALGNCTASAASGSITFGRTFTAPPVCVVWDQAATSTVSMPVYTVSATAITLTTIISTHILGWMCFGTIASS